MVTNNGNVLHIPGRIPTLEIIHDRFVRMFRITLSGALRTPVDISVRSTELINFEDYLSRIPVPSSLNLFRLNPLQGTAIMALETQLIFKLLEIFYGGTGELEMKAGGRDFTPIEQRLIKRVILSALEDLQTAWSPNFKVHISYQRTEINPLFVAIVPQSETVVAVTFDVNIGKMDPTTITICMPYPMIQPLVFYFKAKSVLKLPMVKNLTGILDLGYKATPLPSLIQNMAGRIKQNFTKIQPEQDPISEPQNNQHPSKGSLAFLKEFEPTMVASHIMHEHPQTIALILVYIEDLEHAAQVLKNLPKKLQADVTYRMAILKPIPPGVIAEIEAVLSQELIASKAAVTKVGGIGSVAEMLNTLDKSTEGHILTTIEKSNPDLAEQIRELMFTFEDLVLVKPIGIQAIMKEIPQKEFILTLKTASDPVKEHIYGSMSKGASDKIREDLNGLGPVRIADVESAQQKLVKIARKLEAEGKIIISGANDVKVAKIKKKISRKKSVKKTQPKKTTQKPKDKK